MIYNSSVDDLISNNQLNVKIESEDRLNDFINFLNQEIIILYVGKIDELALECPKLPFDIDSVS